MAGPAAGSPAAHSAADETFPRLLLAHARARPDRPAIREKDYGIWQTWTWSQVAAEVRALACGLAEQGFKRGDHLAIIGANRPRLYWALTAAQSLGGIPVPLYEDAVAQELVYVFQNAEIGYAIVENQEQVDKLLDILPGCPALKHIYYADARGLRHYGQPELLSFERLQAIGRDHDRDHPGLFAQEVDQGRAGDTAAMHYTSGTTGHAKGVVLAHRNLIAAGRSAAQMEGLTADEEVLAYLPMAWIGQNIFSYTQSYVTGFCVSCPESAETVMTDMRLLSAAEGPPRQPGRLHLGRRAADDRGGPSVDGAAGHDPARRTLHGPRAAGGGGDFRDRARSQPEGTGELPAGRAEHHGGAALRRLWLHPGERPGGDGRRRRRARRQRGREGVLSRHFLGPAEKLSRYQILSAQKALVVLMEHYDALETRPPEQRERALLAALPDVVAHAQKNAPGFARILSGIDARDVSSRAALAELPVTRKSDLIGLQQAAPPLGGLNATPLAKLAKLFISPGPIYEPEGRSPDWWRLARALFAAGFRPGDLALNTFAYHFTPAGSMMESGALALGCTVVPGGTGQTEAQVATIASLKINGYVGTPSFLKLIAEKADELKTDIGCLGKAMVAAEYLPPALRRALGERGIRVLQCYASADLGSIAYEAAYESDAPEGMILDEQLILEIVRPGTADPVAEGEVGEVVITTLNPDYPLIRFGTGDLSAVLPGTSPCGRTNTRIRGWMGRADQRTKVKALFVDPAQVAEVVKRHREIVKARLVVDTEAGQDRMTLHCEVSGTPPGGLVKAIAESLREVTKLRGEAALRKPGELANDGKVIEDARKYE